MEEKDATITEFVKKNQAVMVGVALFTALAEFSSSFVKETRLAHAFSGLFLGIVVLLLFELYRNFPKKLSDSLYFFKSFFGLSAGLFIVYWMIINLDLILYILTGLVSGFILAGLLFLYKRIRWGKQWRMHI